MRKAVRNERCEEQPSVPAAACTASCEKSGGNEGGFACPVFQHDFYQLLEASHVANTTLTYRHVTVFAPTNRAFQKYNGSTKNLVLYHMCE
ncbi:hypothetical protein DMN91_006171 [Ooceraea biroi]|uniref:FAS1 domain-containing protein n=1 Tax=Ooceraea biroi TaxID=2015173 RepID=A0A3L8DMW8_OOCBI|nr:hypothetical protein DMN91_006171 [Ooceraea biroi]